jgi:hypothetical protein
MDTFQENIKRWVQLDNQITLLKNKNKTLNDEKNGIEDNILVYVEKNNLENATAKISDGKLKFTTNKQTTPLTFKHVDDSLRNFIKDEETISQIMEHIKNNREIKYTKNIKRYFDKQ